MAVHLVLRGSLALLASAVSGGWARPPQRTAHIRHLSHSHHTLPLLTMTTEPTDDGADGTEDAPNAFEDAMRKLTGDEEYRFGDLTKKTVAAGEDAIKGTLSELTGKDADVYQFGDITKMAVTSFTGKEEYNFGDISRKMLSDADAALEYFRDDYFDS